VVADHEEEAIEELEPLDVVVEQAAEEPPDSSPVETSTKRNSRLDASEVSLVGVAFLDIADYTYLSQFLSPQENQDVLNGLYTAFAGVLNRHGGYLNKIEGDSLMFHYGGSIDPNVRGLSEAQAERYIARELFNSCVEMQRVSAQFNGANEGFLSQGVSSDARESLRKAFEIVSNLRSSELARSMAAVFQIRIRIGANIGRVTIGNFGPDGAKQVDVIGTAVIDAKRMESTAPVGGLRISETLYNTLVETHVAQEYFARFRREAEIYNSYYKSISQDELYKFSEVLLKDKRGATFRTYSVQVTPNLPESVADQVKSLIDMGASGAERVIKLIQYYRGNQYVMNAIEDTFRDRSINIVLRKRFILETMYPLQFKALEQQFDGNVAQIAEHVDQHFSLYELLDKLGRFQDIVKEKADWESIEADFSDYESYMGARERDIRGRYEVSKKHMIQRAYFFNVVFPLVFESIRSSILEYQQVPEELEMLSGA